MERTGVVGGSDQDSKGPKDTGGHFYLATLIGTHSHGSFPCALSLHLRGQWHSKWRQIRPNQSPSFAQLELHLPVALPSNLRIPFILSPVDITCAWPTPTLTPSLGLFQDKTVSQLGAACVFQPGSAFSNLVSVLLLTASSQTERETRECFWQEGSWLASYADFQCFWSAWCN